MNKYIQMSIDEPQQSQQVMDIATTNIEVFRRQSTAALQQYTKHERHIIHRLEQETIGAYDFLARLETELVPLRDELDAKRLYSPFHTSLAKQILQEPEFIQPAVDLVVTYSDNFHIDSFIRTVANPERRDSDWLRHFITTTPKTTISLVKDHYVSAALHQYVASERSIIIVDPYANILRRMRDSSRIRKDRRKTVANEKKRLRYIAIRRAQLSLLHNKLIPDIGAADWNLVEVLAMRQEYEKRLSSLHVNDVLDDTQRLTLFDSVTKSFKKKHTKHAVTTSLESARQSSAKVDTLLLRIFDLSVTQKNQLLLDFKEFRDLRNEEEVIMQDRSNRRNEKNNPAR